MSRTYPENAKPQPYPLCPAQAIDRTDGQAQQFQVELRRSAVGEPGRRDTELHSATESHRDVYTGYSRARRASNSTVLRPTTLRNSHGSFSSWLSTST